MMKEIAEFNKDLMSRDGHITVKDFLSKSEINSCINTIKKLEPKLHVPFSDEGWGFGALIGFRVFDTISDRIEKFLNGIEATEKKFSLNHVVCNRKPAWIGPEVEYHQEVLNSKTFAAGASHDKIRENWVQVYIPLHDEDATNGGLRIITDTHKLDALSYDDIISPNFGHKRRVKPAVLSNIVSSPSHRVVDLRLRAGDALFFSPFLIHASPSNGSPAERLSLVAQSRPNNFEPDLDIFNEETAFRKRFVSEELQKIIDKNALGEKYKEFVKLKEG